MKNISLSILSSIVNLRENWMFGAEGFVLGLSFTWLRLFSPFEFKTGLLKKERHRELTEFQHNIYTIMDKYIDMCSKPPKKSFKFKL